MTTKFHNPIPMMLLLAPLAMWQVCFTVPTQKPNILVIMVDEMMWNGMSCAGHEIVKTPHLDRLAREAPVIEGVVPQASGDSSFPVERKKKKVRK